MTDSWWTFEDALSPEHDLCRKEIKRLMEEVRRLGIVSVTSDEEPPPSHWWVVPPYPTAPTLPDLTITPNADQTVRVKVNKQTHQIRYKEESETEVTVTIEPKELK